MAKEQDSLFVIVIHATSSSGSDETRTRNQSRLRMITQQAISILTNSVKDDSVRRQAQEILDTTLNALLEQTLTAKLDDRFISSNLLISLLSEMASKKCFSTIAVTGLDRKLKTSHFWSGQPDPLREKLQTIAIIVDTLCLAGNNLMLGYSRGPIKQASIRKMKLPGR